jgi:hypothetical protein
LNYGIIEYELGICIPRYKTKLYAEICVRSAKGMLEMKGCIVEFPPWGYVAQLRRAIGQNDESFDTYFLRNVLRMISNGR